MHSSQTTRSSTVITLPPAMLSGAGNVGPSKAAPKSTWRRSTYWPEQEAHAGGATSARRILWEVPSDVFIAAMFPRARGGFHAGAA
jgi:hypothetical protein